MAPLCNDHYYGKVEMHTLFDEKEHDPEHRKGVCCRGKLTDHGRYRCEGIRRYALGCRQGTGHPVHLLLRHLLPIVVLVLYPPVRDAVVVHLVREGPTARFLHDGGTYWKQSKRVFTEGAVSIFARSFIVLEAGVGCPDSPCMKTIELWSVEAA